MARKPNYAFERNARAKAKAEKREAKRQAKLASNKVETDDTSAPAASSDAATPGDTTERQEPAAPDA